MPKIKNDDIKKTLIKDEITEKVYKIDFSEDIKHSINKILYSNEYTKFDLINVSQFLSSLLVALCGIQMSEVSELLKKINFVEELLYKEVEKSYDLEFSDKIRFYTALNEKLKYITEYVSYVDKKISTDAKNFMSEKHMRLIQIIKSIPSDKIDELLRELSSYESEEESKL